MIVRREGVEDHRPVRLLDLDVVTFALVERHISQLPPGPNDLDLGSGMCPIRRILLATLLQIFTELLTVQVPATVFTLYLEWEHGFSSVNN